MNEENKEGGNSEEVSKICYLILVLKCIVFIICMKTELQPVEYLKVNSIYVQSFKRFISIDYTECAGIQT